LVSGALAGVSFGCCFGVKTNGQQATVKQKVKNLLSVSPLIFATKETRHDMARRWQTVQRMPNLMALVSGNSTKVTFNEPSKDVFP